MSDNVIQFPGHKSNTPTSKEIIVEMWCPYDNVKLDINTLRKDHIIYATVTCPVCKEQVGKNNFHPRIKDAPNGDM